MSEPSFDPGGTRCVHCGDVHPASYTHCPKTGKVLAAGKALIGRIFADRYKVLGLLGEGGMGAVYVAEHLLIGRKVALKRLHPELAADAKAVARFQREARAAAATGHENIVEILDLGYAEDGAPFLVMEYLKGQSLAQTLRREGRLAPARACHVVGQVLAALGAVHRQQIVHRDLKPDNVFLMRRGGRSDYVKVLDFGISKMRREEENALDLTKTGVMLGTPFYMSPEQARGMKDLDHRVDLYATGVILYECLTGKLPFEGTNYHALLQAILRGEAPKIREAVPDVDEGLAEIVHRAIAKEPGARFQDAASMQVALVPYGASDTSIEEPEPDGGLSREDIQRRLAADDERDEEGVAPTTPNERPVEPPRAARGGPIGVPVVSVALPPAARLEGAAPAVSAPAPVPSRTKDKNARGVAPTEQAPSLPKRGTEVLEPQRAVSAPPGPGPAAPLAPASAPEPLGDSRAPRPRAPVGPPRPFVACSDDWVEGGQGVGMVLPPPRPAATSGAQSAAIRGRESRPGDVPRPSGVADPSSGSYGLPPSSGSFGIPQRDSAPPPPIRASAPGREPTGPQKLHRPTPGFGLPALPSTPPSLTPVTPTPSRAPKALSGDAQVKGSLLLAAIEHVEQAHGKPALDRLVGELPPELRARVSGVILPVAWFPLAVYDALLGAAEATLGAGDGGVAVEIGAATAARDLPTTHRLFMQSATPAMALERIPLLWKTYCSRGEALVEPVGTGGFRVTVRELDPDTYLHAMAMSGFYRQLLVLAGARDVRSTVLSSRGRGDEKTITALRWR